MNRQRAKELAPIIMAFGDGKIVQMKCRSGHDEIWSDTDFPDFEKYIHRLKPEPECISFTVEDFNMFMLKYIKRKYSFESIKIIGCSEYCVLITIGGNINNIPYEKLFKEWEFIDGSPCGKLKE
jgi:hypothetical protein